MKRPRHWLAISLAASFFVVGYTVLAPTALPKLWQMEGQIEALSTDNQHLIKQIESLNHEVRLLSANSDASLDHLERIIRKELSYIGKGEFLVLFEARKGEKSK